MTSEDSCMIGTDHDVDEDDGDDDSERLRFRFVMCGRSGVTFILLHRLLNTMLLRHFSFYCVTNWLFNSKEQSSFWEDDCRSFVQEIFHRLWKQKVCYHILKSPTPPLGHTSALVTVFLRKVREEVPKLILVSSRNIAVVYEAIFARMRSKKPEVLSARRQSCKVCCVCYAMPGLEPAVLAEDGKCGRSVGRRVTRSQQLWYGAWQVRSVCTRSLLSIMFM
jgi:hypothetical protein